MTFDDALQGQVTQFDRKVKDLREILLTPNYDNEETLEVRRLKYQIIKIVHRTFELKVCKSEAESLITIARNQPKP